MHHTCNSERPAILSTFQILREKASEIVFYEPYLRYNLQTDFVLFDVQDEILKNLGLAKQNSSLGQDFTTTLPNNECSTK